MPRMGSVLAELMPGVSWGESPHNPRCQVPRHRPTRRDAGGHSPLLTHLRCVLLRQGVSLHIVGHVGAGRDRAISVSAAGSQSQL